MTRSRQPRLQVPPLADTLRAALAQGWHTLDALDAMAPARGSSDKRRAVHAALGELRAAGCVLEDRVQGGRVEVRLLTLPAPVPDDGSGEWEPAPVKGPSAAPPAPPPDLDAAPVGDEPAAPAEAATAPAAREPGPSSRCARPGCGVRYTDHGADRWQGHPFAPKPRGRPPATPSKQPPIPNAAPAILPRGRQRRERGPVVDVDGGRVERAPTPPCIDCGEEPGSCPEGRCRDCDLEHGMSAGACRECHVWIIREDVGGPLAKQHAAGCSLAESDDWHARNAAEYAAIRTARYGWAPEPRRGCEREHVAPAYRAPGAEPPRPAGRCRPPACHADDIHEPSRVRGFARPLCERHRAWLEGAGGTVAPVASVAEWVTIASAPAPSTPPTIRAFRRAFFPAGPLTECAHLGPRCHGPEGEFGGHLVFLGSDVAPPHGEGVVVYTPIDEPWDVEAMRAEIIAAVRATASSEETV